VSRAERGAARIARWVAKRSAKRAEARATRSLGRPGACEVCGEPITVVRSTRRTCSGNRLMTAARKNRDGHRDATMILLAFRHGLRASELTDLRWDQVDFNQGVLHVRRVKNGSPATHPLDGEELRALRRPRREAPESPFAFVSMRGAPFTVSGFRRMVERAGQDAGLEIRPHPHMLRHATGFALANKGVDTRTLQAYLGHKNIQHTVKYTELSATRFKGLWD
jgi:type 1 fimbriae regulatory protein FimB/type 1 fimbriae regulatory protein FimE